MSVVDPIALYLPDEDATAQLGAALAHALLAERSAIEQGGCLVGLSGDLGAGKTALVRAILRTLGESGPVKSPTFALLEPYVVSSLNFYHFDFYRFKRPDEFTAAGFGELFGAGAICAVEWPEHAVGRLPAPDVAVALVVRDDGRNARLTAGSALGRQCLSHALNEWSARGGA